MRRAALVLALLAACTKDDGRRQQELADHVDDVAGEARKVSERVDVLEKKMDELSLKLDHLSAKLDEQAVAAAARPAARPAPARRPEPDPAAVYAVPIDGDPVEGPATALVTIVEGFDYACPYCERVRATLASLRDEFPKDVRIVRKMFVVHPQVATTPAIAACAANLQGKFAKMDELLWDKAFANRTFDEATIRDLAKEAGVNLKRMDADWQTCTDFIAKDQAQLQQVGQGATPTFFINGRYMSGAQPIDAFRTLVREELDKAKGRGGPAKDYYATYVLGQGAERFDPNGP